MIFAVIYYELEMIKQRKTVAVDAIDDEEEEDI
jgi:hypothetical protein